MNFSKRIIHWTTVMMSGFVLSACIPNTQDRPDGLNNDAANFAIVSVGGSIGGSKNVGEFPLPGEKTYNFKVCLVDYTRRTNIPNAKFMIKEIEQEVTTDAQGCLNWPETIKFNYLADSIWLKLTRTLEAKGLQRGIREAKLAINPWSHGESLNEVMDLMKQTTPYLVDNDDEVKQRLAGNDKDGKLKTRKIWVENGDRKVTNGKQQGKAFTWHDQIFLKPQILFSKTDATPHLVAVTHGSFQAEISLILEDVQDQKSVRQLKARQVVSKVTMTNGTLMIEADFSLEEVPTSGQTFMGIKLIPLGAPAGLLPFEGIFPLGTDHSFTQSAGLQISENVAKENQTSQFTLNKFLGLAEGEKITGINGVGINVPANSAGSQNTAKAGVYLKPMHVSDFRIISEKGQKKIMSYRVSACFESTVINIGLAHRKFQIQSTSADGQALDIDVPNVATTEKTGCLHFEVKTPEFDRNDCAHLLPTSVLFHNKDLGDLKGSLFIDPWMEMGWDHHEVPKNRSERQQSCDKANVIYLNAMNFQRNYYRPQVLDRSLQLTQRGIYQITLSNPGVVEPGSEYSGLTPGKKDLPIGKYLLRLVFVRSALPRPDNGYVAHADVIMDSMGSALTGEMDITIKDLQSTFARKMVLAQLFPINMEKFNAKKWTNNAPDIEELIDRKTPLKSPIYSAKTITLGAPTPITLKPVVEGHSSLPETITRGLSKDIQSSNLISEIAKIGEAGQAAMIEKTAFKETDGKAWAKWSQDQNLQLTWMSDEKSVQKLQHDFSLKGDAKASLQNLIEMPKLDDTWAKQFCQILIDGPWKSLLRPPPPPPISHRGGPTPPPNYRMMFINACREIVKTNSSAFFKKSAVYRILSMQPAVLNTDKISVSNLSVSSGFGFTAGHTQMEGTQGGITATAQGGASGKFGGVSLGASYGTVVIQTTDRNRHSGQDLSESISLSVTKWQFKIPVTRYQKCTMLRANPDVFLFEKDISWKDMFPKWITQPEVTQMNNLIDTSALYRPHLANNPLFQGWLICSDKVSTQPISVPETYFMISQGNGDSETYDSMDEINRRFFLPLRGISDMARFKGIVGQSIQYPQDGELTDQLKADLAEQISPLIRRVDPAPGMVLFDPAFQVPKLFSDDNRPKKSEDGN